MSFEKRAILGGQPKYKKSDENPERPGTFIADMEQFTDPVTYEDGTIESTSKEKELLRSADMMVREKLASLGLELGESFDEERLKIFGKKYIGLKRPQGDYNPEEEEIRLNKGGLDISAFLREIVTGRESINSRFKQERQFKTLVHELIHYYQQTYFSENEEGEVEAIGVSFSTKDENRENDYQKNMFAGILEFGTESLALEILEENKEFLSENFERNTKNPKKTWGEHHYISDYGISAEMIFTFLSEKYKESPEEIKKKFYKSLISGDIDKTYLKAITAEYGKDALRILSYLGSKPLERIMSAKQHGEKGRFGDLVGNYFNPNTSSEEREELAILMHETFGNERDARMANHKQASR